MPGPKGEHANDLHAELSAVLSEVFIDTLANSWLFVILSFQVRCSGQASSCDRCTAVGAVCKYPTHEAYRKKSVSGRKAEVSPPCNGRSSSSSSSSGANPPPRGDQCRERGQSESQRNSIAETVDVQIPPISDDGLDMFDFDAEFDSDQQQAENWLSSYKIGLGVSRDGSSSGGDDWMNIDNFINPRLMGSADYTSDKMDLTGDGMFSSLSGGSESPSGETRPSLAPECGNLSLTARVAKTAFHDLLQRHSSGASDSLAPPFSASEYGVSSPMTLKSPSFPGQLRQVDSHISPALDLPPLSLLENWVDPSSPQSLFSTDSAGKQAKQDSKQPSPSPRAATGDDCSCLHLTACLLEELGAKSASSDPTAMDVLLSYFRSTISSCATIINCERCTSASENNVLLAMAGRYISTICERIVICYLRIQHVQGQQPHQQQQRPTSSPLGSSWVTSTHSSGGGSSLGRPRGSEEDASGAAGALHFSNGGDDMWFSSYRVGSNYERMQVLRCIVTVQVAEFWRLLEKLRARAGAGKGHLVLLAEAEARTKKARALLRASAGRPMLATP